MRVIDSDEVIRIVREEVKDEDNTLPVSFRAGVDYVLKIMNELPERDTSKIITADTAGNSLILKINHPDCSNKSDCEAKAIPIEWIEEYWNVKDEIITYDVFTVINNEQEIHCSIPVRTKCVQELINDMIEDWEWEKENESETGK